MRIIFSIGCFLTFIFNPIGVYSQYESNPWESQIDSILQMLTLEEKVAMCHAQSKFSTKGVPRLGIPEIWMSDGPHGVRAELSWDSWDYAGWTNDSVTAFPALTCLAATFNPDLAFAYGKALGEEARFRKKDVLLGPGVNIYRTPLNGRNFEYMGEDPLLASNMAVPYIRGVQQNGVAACIKHFVLNNQERWRDHINVEVSERALREIYLPAFRAAVQEGKSWTLMGAYNQFRGQYCCHNDYLLNQILKKEWGFDGVVITDWGGAHDTRESALHGLDIEMGTGTNGLTTSVKNAFDYYFLAKPFLNLLESGEIDEAIVNEKVRRILRLQFRTNLAANRPWGSLNTAAHQMVARQVAREGMVLLKNQGSFFPIDPGRPLTIAVIGENATRMMTTNGGSSDLKAQYEISPLEGLRKRFPNAKILHAMGYASGPSVYGKVLPSSLDAEVLEKAALEAASKADLVLFFGGLNKSHHQDCEGGDRLQYHLPFDQDKLIEKLQQVNLNIGVVLISGNAVAMPWLPKVKGIIQAWYLGSETGHAIGDIISGDINPSGKLPFTFPVKLEDNAAHHFGRLSYPGDSINQYYKEDILVGYRWHDTKNIPPLFAFGFGLSYTQFEISKLEIAQSSLQESDSLVITGILENTGAVSGSETIQVYIGIKDSNITRAAKELKGFAKIKLEKGEKRAFQVKIPVHSLQYYDEKSRAWKLEPGKYQAQIGNSSDRIVQVLEFFVS